MNAIIVSLILLAILVIAFLAYNGKEEIIYKMIYALVNEAEDLYGSKTGKIKYAYVVERIYTMLPPFMRIFITHKTLERWIEKALTEAKEYWKQKAEEADKPTV